MTERLVFLSCLACVLVVRGAVCCVAADRPSAVAPSPADVPIGSSPLAAEPSDGNKGIYPTTGPETARRAQQELLPVNDLGDPNKLLFEGATSFPAEDVRQALRNDLKYQAASRPSNASWHFRRVLAQRVRLGYRSHGFPDAKVTVRRDDAKPAFIVHVDESDMYRQGKIVVRGTDKLDANALREWLAHPQAIPGWQINYGRDPLPLLADDQAALFRAGDAVDYSAATRRQLQSAIRWALIEQGFAGARIWPKWRPSDEPGVADLVIDVLDAGQLATADAIEVRGLQRDSQESLLKYLGVSKKDCLDGKLLRRIDQRLTDSCRYWSHKLTMEIDTQPFPIDKTSSTTIKLVLDLEEFTPSPPLDQPLAEVDEILRKSAAWMNKLHENNGNFAIVCEGKLVDAENPSVMLEFHPLAVASDGRVAANIKYVSNTWTADHAIVITSQSAELVDWTRRERFSLDLPIKPRIAICLQPDRKEDGEYGQKLTIGYNVTRLDAESQKHSSLDLRFVPVAFVHLAHRPGAKVAIRDGKLTTSNDGVEIQFDAASGAILQVRCMADLDNGSKLTMRFDSGQLDDAAVKIRCRDGHFSNQFDSGHPVSSSLTFILDQALSQPCVAASPELSAKCASIRAWLQHPIVSAPLDQIDEKFADADWSAPDEVDNFNIPSRLSTRADDAEELWDSVAQLSIVSADQLFPRGSWPWTLMREYGFHRFADGTADDSQEARQIQQRREFSRSVGGKDLGPLSALLFLAIGESKESDADAAEAEDKLFRSLFVECGLNNLSDEGILNDVRMFTSNETEFGKLCCTSAEKYCALSDSQQAQLRDALPELCRPLLAALNKRHDANPQEPIAKSIEKALLDDWHNRLRDKVESELRAHAATVAQQPSSPSQQR